MLLSTDVSKMLKWVHIDNTVFSLFNVCKVGKTDLH